MTMELEEMLNGKWEEHSRYLLYVNMFEENNFSPIKSNGQKIKADLFLLQAYRTLHRHFKIFTSHLLFLGLFSKKDTSVVCAKFLVGVNDVYKFTNGCNSYVSPTHAKKSISKNLQRFFLHILIAISP